MITLDTSAVYALLDRRDPDHAAVKDAIDRDPGPYVIPSAMLAELASLVETRLGAGVMDALLADLESGAYTLDCGEDDLPRVRALATRYASSLPLGATDAAVIACAERNGGRVLTLDRRDFDVVAGEGTIVVLPLDTT